MNDPDQRDGACVITVRGAVGSSVRAALDDVQVTVVGDRTVLRRSETDQAAMHGLLRRLQDLGLVVIDVHLDQTQPSRAPTLRRRAARAEHRRDRAAGGRERRNSRCGWQFALQTPHDDHDARAAMTRLSKIFQLNRQGFNLRRSIGVLVVMLLPLIVCTALDQQLYYFSVAFGALFVGVNDPGGQYGYRLPRMVMNAVAGALLTALGFAIGAGAWGVVVLAAFVVTLVAGLMVKYGLHGFTSAYVLNCWFLVAIAMLVGYQLSHGHTNAWAQALAWLIGSALTISWTAIVWLARGRTAQARPLADLLPGSTEPVPLTRPVILFALIRAVAVAIAVAIAFGFHLPDADWMPIACLISMKSSLAQSTLVGLQRLAGAIIGSAVAAVFLLTVDTKIVLGMVTVILGTLAGAVRAVNYALYCAALAAAVLIAEDLPNPTDLGHEARRVLFTFFGVGIAVGVMLLAGLLTKRAAKPAGPTPAPAGPA
jgi:hypothetical protein